MRTRAVAKIMAEIGLCTCLLASAWGKDQKAAGETPRFVAHTSLVLIPAVVTDNNGNHVTGLTKDDFVITENDQGRKSSVFEEIKTEAGQINKVSPRQSAFANVSVPLEVAPPPRPPEDDPEVTPSGPGSD